MKWKVAFAVLFVTSVCSYGAKLKVGDTVPNYCWKDIETKTVCLDDFKNTVRVMLYNSTYCGWDNLLFQELVPNVSEFAGKPVTFISLTVGGKLEEWKEKHNIPFTVARGTRQEMYDFTDQIATPLSVIVDSENKLTFAKLGSNKTAIFTEIHKLVP